MEALNQYWLEDGPLVLKLKPTILPLKKSISVKNIPSKNQRDQLTVVELLLHHLTPGLQNAPMVAF